MREYFEAGFTQALLQMCNGVLSFVFLAYLLHLVGSRLKCEMKSLFGKFERVLAVPGEFFRNVGISIACMLTGTKIRRHIIRSDESGTSASVTHSRMEAGTPMGFIRNLIILTAPIWFGCIVLGIFVFVAGGVGMMPDVKSVFADGDVGFIKYVTSVFWEALSMLGSLVCVWHWTSPFCLFCLVCFISIATEITIDTRSIWSIKAGLFGLFVILIVLNAIPGMTTAFATIGRTVRPILFRLHVILLFVVFFDFAAVWLFKALSAVFHRARAIFQRNGAGIELARIAG